MANYTLDIKKPSCQFIIEGLHLGDNGFRDFYFHFTDGASAFSLPEGSVVTLFASLPDGTVVYDSCTLFDESTVLYSLKGGTERASITSCTGICNCELRVTDKSMVLTSPKFAFLIEDTLQCDSAIEAQDSFSALTDALGRVLEAESGVLSKADKVHGTVGNTAAIGEDGNVYDSGIVPVSRYNFYYAEDGSYNEYNRALKDKLVADHETGRPFTVTLSDYLYNVCYPATAHFESDRLNIYAIEYDSSCYMSISMTANVTKYNTNEVVSNAFDEAKNTAATQKATADWVKAYVDESIVEGEW